ncbi:MAG: hypothetical protein GSR77_03940 [Desulfurococcales archaeon]|nr:hypothetical protein [Desulfurococcales archaeon]
MPQPVIYRGLNEEQIRLLSERKRLAFYSWIGLEPGTRLMIWNEEKAEWIYAVVKELVEKPSIEELRRLVEFTPYKGLQEWLEAENSKHDGSLPGKILLVEKVQPGV